MRLIDADALIEFCAERWIPLNIDAVNMQPTIQPEKTQLSQEDTTSDLISRTETVEHLRRVLGATVPITDYDEGFVDGVEFGVSTASTMPTIQPVATDTNVGDTISRQWLMECVNEGWIKFDTEKDENRFIHLVRDIAPSAQPEPHEGHWILVAGDLECSECHTRYPDLYPDYADSVACPHCGAHMKGATT